MKLPIAVKVSATPCMSVVCLLYVSEETYMTLLGSGCEHPRPQKKEADPEGPTSPTDTAQLTFLSGCHDPKFLFFVLVVAVGYLAPRILRSITLVPRPTSFQKL